MQAILIIELKIRFQSSFCIRDRLILLEIHLLVLNASPEPFNENIVQCSSSAIPTDAHVCCLEPVRKFRTGKLRSLVVVENLRSRPLKCLLERFETKRCFQRDGSSPGEHIATEPVDDGYQIQEPSLHADVGNICAPDLIDAIECSVHATNTDTARFALLVDSTLVPDRSPSGPSVAEVGQPACGSPHGLECAARPSFS